MNRILIIILVLAVFLLPAEAKMSAQSAKLYNSALVQEQEGNYKTALEYIKKALQYSPDDAVLNIKLAGIYTNLNNYPEAIQAYNRAILLRGEDGFLHISLANLYTETGDYKNALASYEKAQLLMPQYCYNYINIANTKALLKDYSGAISAYNKFLESYPDNLEGLTSIANIHLEQKDYTKAIEYFALALRTNPSDFREYSNYGNALYEKGDYSKAEIAFKSAVGINKNDSVSLANLALSQMKQQKNQEALQTFEQAFKSNDSTISPLRQDWAHLLAQSGNTKQAIEQYELFLKEYPASTNATISLSQLYSKTARNIDAINILKNFENAYGKTPELNLELARLYQNTGKYEDALAYYNEILSKDKENYFALYNKAVIQAHLGETQNSRAILTKLLTVDENVLAKNEIYHSDIKEDLTQTLIKEAQSLIAKGEIKKAKAMLEPLLKEPDTTDYRVFAGLGDIALMQNMNNYAKNYFEQALQCASASTDTDLLSHYAQALFSLEDYLGADAVLEQALLLAPEDDRLYYNKALVQYSLKNYSTAYSVLSRALDINPTAADYHYLSGLILEALNLEIKAISAFEKYLELSDDQETKAKVNAHIIELTTPQTATNANESDRLQVEE